MDVLIFSISMRLTHDNACDKAISVYYFFIQLYDFFDLFPKKIAVE
jgi:hypothetical protein